ncbi:helix-turn-helix domain-containing protein [Streptomyces sp. NBC_00285]|uniref:helix-turn-helix domain-containing protein n=1 Tax=Streptomyces sp. NBC_00285 TaxID=2975700 RepID=UPI003FA7E5E7
MGRPERPLDPGTGPVQRLAYELRDLRKAAGGPSYRAMAQGAGFSATTLSQAAAGERLPSLAVVEGYVRACGGDPSQWTPRWKEAEAELAGAPSGQATRGPAPYRGLARFEPDHRHLFFGRDRMVAEVAELVCDHRFAALSGPSGSGKSSLLRAGLIPRLRQEIAERGHPAVLRVLTPGPTPATSHGHLLAPARGEPESWVVVDQFEEVFTLCRDPRERARFVDLLLTARDPASRLRVLVAVRADFHDRCAEHRGLADVLRGAGLPLGPMTARELREAVVGPAQAVGCLVERTLTDRLVDEIQGEPGGLPMLAHVLLETWRRRRGRMLTLAAYESAGGVRGAIAASAEEIYGALTPAQARTARHLLLRMVVPGGQGTPDTRRPLGWAELAQWADPDVPAVVERLTRARLVTAGEDGVQLAHEALITCWPRLQGWLEEDRERLRRHRTLADAARTWLDHDRCPDVLYRGTGLSRAEELFPDHRTDPALTVTERAFLAAAVRARETERRAAVRAGHRHRVLTASLSALSALLAAALLSEFAGCCEHEDDRRPCTRNAAGRVADLAGPTRAQWRPYLPQVPYRRGCR